MQALIAEITDLHVPELPEYERRRGRVRGRPEHVVLRGARRVRPDAPLPRPDVAAPLRVPAARLRRVHDLLRALQEPAAGHPRPARRADDRRDRRAALQAERRAAQAGEAGDRHGRRRGLRRGAHAGRDRRRARRERGGSRLARGARGDQGSLVQHGDRRRPLPLLPQLVRRPEHRVRVGRRPRAGAPGRRGGRAPDRGARTRARPARGGVRRAARRGDAEGVPGAARALAHRLPLRRGAQVLLRLLVPDAVVEQGARVRRAPREARLPRGRGGRLPARSARGRAGARRARPDLGHGRRSRSDPRTGRRSSPDARSCSSGSASGRRRPRSARRRRRSPTRP